MVQKRRDGWAEYVQLHGGLEAIKKDYEDKMTVVSNAKSRAALPARLAKIEASERRPDERAPSMRRSSMATFATIEEEPEDQEPEPPKIPFMSSYAEFPSLAAQQSNSSLASSTAVWPTIANRVNVAAPPSLILSLRDTDVSDSEGTSSDSHSGQDVIMRIRNPSVNSPQTPTPKSRHFRFENASVTSLVSQTSDRSIKSLHSVKKKAKKVIMSTGLNFGRR